MEDKRKHLRYPVIHEVGQPIHIGIEGKNVPGVLVDLSAGGTALLLYTNFHLGTTINIVINIPGLITKEIEGQVVWAIPKGEMWRLGISFSKIDSADVKHINKMAFDYNDCCKKIELGVKDVCTDTCSYIQLCASPLKNKK